jgi:peptidoglycan/xylan/chitin deacetylase (PgdA/CDA1 family)
VEDHDAAMPHRTPLTLRLIVSLLILHLVAPIAAAQNSDATVSPTISEPGTVVGAQSVNIRSCPKLDCSVLMSARLGDAVTVTGDPVDGFLPVRLGSTAGYAYSLFVATETGGTPALRQGLPGCQRVAFIFNIGVGYPPDLDVLEWLEANDIPATLFPMGWWAEEHPDVLQEMADLGFLIGSHGDERTELTGRSDAEVVADITHAVTVIERAIGREPAPYFTPYAAAMDERVRSIVARAGYIPVAWDVAAADWDFDVTPDDVFQSVMPNVVDGSIVEFHLDAPTSPESTGVAIPWIVERLERKGYEFVTVADMALPCP